RRAIGAALAAQSVLRSIDGTRARVGVAAGPVVAGGSGAPGDRFFVVGRPLEEARRLRELAATGEVRVEQALVDEELHEWEPVADGDGVTLTSLRRGAASSTLELPFVGRDRELRELAEALRQCRRSGTGRVVVVAGEAGIGKTRLLDRAQHRFAESGVRAARGLVSDFDVGEDLTQQLVRDLLGLDPDASDVTAALEARLGPGALGPAQWPFLFHFLGVPLSGPMQRVYDAMEPAARRAGYRDMLATFLTSDTAQGPVVLMIEDMHWADETVLEAVETLSGVSRSLPVLLVLTTRVEGEERWRGCLSGQTVTRLELSPLGDEDASALAMALGGDAERRGLAIARAAGHPLFLTEILRDAEAELPPTIHGLIHSRLDRLPERDRAAAQVAAVLGRRATLIQLRRVLDDPSYDPANLVLYRLLEEEDGQVAFTHAVVRDAVYESLVEDDRRALHVRCAAQLPEEPAVRGAHLDRAGLGAEAADAYLEASRRALAADRYEEARLHAARGHGLASAGSEVARRALRLRGQVELLLGDAEASEASHAALLEQAETDAERYEGAVGRAEASFVASHFEEALRALDAADAYAASAGVPAGRASYVRGRVGFATGRLEACHEAHARALHIAREEGDLELATRASSGMADALYGVGRLASAHAAYAECVAGAREAGLHGVLAVNEPLLSIVSVFMLDLDRALQLAEETRSLTHDLAHKRGETLAHGATSLAGFHAGDPTLGLIHAEHAIALGRVTGTRVFEANGHYYAARSAIELGDRELARDHVERGLELARSGAMQFLGGALLATAARLADGVDERAARLAEGAAVIAAPCLSFNRLWFHENAIEASLESRDAAGARAHADAIDAFTAAEPFPWASLVSDRGRALAAHLEGDGEDALRDVLERMQATKLALGRAAVEAALSGR
ncbi:MAG: AAA family ATPase, partial [Sandaracinaceae bacterium]|nr:AAA family ATPase [Sandaracinaceae bacterium]